jgi:hypothetical protein
MNIHAHITGLLLALVMAVVPAALMAADAGKSSNSSKTNQPTSQPTNQKAVAGSTSGLPAAKTVPVYMPPRRGAPLARVGGGSRGIDDGLPFVSVITPEHTGFTSSKQPVLYWYISENMKTRFEFALITEDDIDPIVEVTSEQEMQAGLNSMSLADQGITLDPGVPYQWSVALISDENKRSSDVVSTGRIELLELTEGQQAQLENASEEQAVMIYAQEGYWYDLFASLSRLIDKDPGNSELLAQRAALLEQVDLEVVSGQ